MCYQMHDYYVTSFGSYFRLSLVRYDSRTWCVISIAPIFAARQGDPIQYQYFCWRKQPIYSYVYEIHISHRRGHLSNSYNLLSKIFKNKHITKNTPISKTAHFQIKQLW